MAERRPGTPSQVRGAWHGCWEWTGATRYGYGQTTHEGRRVLTHRAAFEAVNGPIPHGLYVLHRCDNRPCFRPDHLFLGTAADNARDMVSKKRQARGENHARAKLTAADVVEIRARYPAETQRKLASEFGVRHETIGLIIRGLRWSHVA